MLEVNSKATHAAHERERRRREHERLLRRRAAARERNRRYRARRLSTGLFNNREPAQTPQFVRCPVCGRLDNGAGLNNAGNHRLDAGRPRSLGRPRGFAWTWEPLSNEVRVGLAELVRRALVQLCGPEFARRVVLEAEVNRRVLTVQRSLEAEIERRVRSAYGEGYRDGLARRRLDLVLARRHQVGDAALAVRRVPLDGLNETTGVQRRVVLDADVERRNGGSP